jgi:hypothetical protein
VRVERVEQPKRKNLRDSLRKRPAADDVSDGDFVNVAPLHLGEEITRIHPSSGLRTYFAPKREDVDLCLPALKNYVSLIRSNFVSLHPYFKVHPRETGCDQGDVAAVC